MAVQQNLGPIAYSNQGEPYQNVLVPGGMYNPNIAARLSGQQYGNIPSVYQQMRQQPICETKTSSSSRKLNLTSSCCIIISIIFIISGIMLFRRNLTNWCKNSANSCDSSTSCDGSSSMYKDDCCIPIEIKWMATIFLIGGITLLILGIWGATCSFP